MKRILGLLLAAALVFGVVRFFQSGASLSRAHRGASVSAAGDTLALKHARNFRLVDFGEYKVLSVLRPWKDAPRSFTVVLAESDSLVPEELRVHPFARVPVRRVVARSAAQVRALDALGELESVVGVGKAEESSIDRFLVRVRRGLVRETGGDADFNEEIAYSLKPDLVLTWATGEGTDVHDRLMDLGIPVAIDAAWMEETPLGRAEWIRFYAAFFGKDSLALAQFEEVESNYLHLKTLAAGSDRSPRVMTGAPSGGVWWTPGAKSWTARLVADAGGTFLWRDDDSDGSTPRGLEAVLERCANADVWINGADSWLSLADLRKEEPRLSLFKPVREAMVWNSNNSRTGRGLSTFWEETPGRPDLLLEDLVHVFHPDLLPNHRPRWYRRLR